MEEKIISSITGQDNLVVVITGCSGQLGYSYQKLFLSLGAKVVGIDLVDKQEDDFIDDKDSRLFVRCDITVKTDIETALEIVRKEFGCPTTLINNAALDSPPNASDDETGPFENYPESSWDKVIDVNLKGTFLCCQIFGAAMSEKGHGSIVNISSIYGLVSPDQSLYQYRRARGDVFFKPVAYSASKSGLANLTRYLAVYWAKSGVRVNTLTIAGVFNNQETDFLDAYCDRIPIGRMASPEDYHGALLFLSSDMSTYMTGSNLIIDGGWTAI